ncbi:MAG: CotH kinase family protein [Actinomycetota bacterium]
MRRTLLLVLTVLALVAASCGDDGDTPAASPSTDAPPSDDAEADDPEVADVGDADEPGDTSEDSRNVGVSSGVPDGSFLFDQDQLHTFEIDLSEENLAILDADPSAEEYVEGEVTFAGETRTVGVRYKGSVGAWVNCLEGTLFSNGFEGIFDPSGAKVCPKLSIKVKINWQNSDDEWHGQRKFQLHAMNLDPTQMRERLGYHLFREMGVPAPRATHARVVVNGEFVGLFALVEQIDGRFTRHNFEDGTGNLYKEIWPLDTAGDPVSEAAFESGLKTNENEDPSFALVTQFATEVSDASDADRPTVVARWMDVETSLAYFAVERTIRHDDSLSHFRCFGNQCNTHNFFIYEDPSNDRFHVIPWDLDNAFQSLAPGPGNSAVAVEDRFGEITNDCEPFNTGGIAPQRSAACDLIIGALATYEAEYEAILEDFLTGPFADEAVREQLERWTAQIAEATAEAADAHPGEALSVAAWDASVEALLRDLENARADAVA